NPGGYRKAFIRVGALLFFLSPTMYTLTINLTSAQLQEFYQAGLSIALGKQGPNSGQPNVVWQAFQPLEYNTVTWQEAYGIYISNAQLTNGNVLMPLSATPMPAVEGTLYTLQADGVITGPSGGEGTPGTYSLLNKYTNQQQLVAGLVQEAVANIRGNSVVMPITSNTTKLLFSSGTPDIAVVFDNNSGSFIPANEAQRKAAQKEAVA
nr:hypothetical protein [Tanacetum cinerariifolium]